MALVVEDGTGVQGAESYASVTFADAYWAARTHDASYTTWSAVGNTTAKKEGALREATAYIDSVYGPHYKGARRGYIQGLLWPRTGAMDERNYPLPDLPEELKRAVAELAVRATAGPLAPDSARDNMIKREKKKVGPLEKEIEYMDGASTESRYGAVEGMMALLVNNSANGSASWLWR